MLTVCETCYLLQEVRAIVAETEDDEMMYSYAEGSLQDIVRKYRNRGRRELPAASMITSDNGAQSQSPLQANDAEVVQHPTAVEPQQSARGPSFVI